MTAVLWADSMVLMMGFVKAVVMVEMKVGSSVTLKVQK